jgi:hypothetical protein
VDLPGLKGFAEGKDFGELGLSLANLGRGVVGFLDLATDDAFLLSQRHLAKAVEAVLDDGSGCLGDPKGGLVVKGLDEGHVLESIEGFARTFLETVELVEGHSELIHF